MCMKLNEGESCEVAKSLSALDKRVGKLEERMDRVDNSLSVGFTQVNESIQQLATDFGTRMNTLDKRIVDEKAKWGECFRSWLGWIIKLLVVGCATAMGITLYETIFGS